MKIQKKQTGFTLVELITVVSMLALLTIFVAREMGQSSNGMKVKLVEKVLISNVPNAIAAHRLENNDNCLAGLDEDTLGAVGVPNLTPWGTAWNASYAIATRTVTVLYDLTGTSNIDTVGAALVLRLAGNSAFSADPTYGSDVITATYPC
ncbi:hypothetical protein A9Q81_07305 [Gammaproteobacteria bacterium 42_54_T18]|mgnify:CR=1 FL=1|nr:hypothetical protein A9Q81_07305 [Gammaproteobacteria bacterium 42_54_T18]